MTPFSLPCSVVVTSESSFASNQMAALCRTAGGVTPAPVAGAVTAASVNSSSPSLTESSSGQAWLAEAAGTSHLPAPVLENALSWPMRRMAVGSNVACAVTFVVATVHRPANRSAALAARKDAEKERKHAAPARTAFLRRRSFLAIGIVMYGFSLWSRGRALRALADVQKWYQNMVRRVKGEMPLTRAEEAVTRQLAVVGASFRLESFARRNVKVEAVRVDVAKVA